MKAAARVTSGDAGPLAPDQRRNVEKLGTALGADGDPCCHRIPQPAVLPCLEAEVEAFGRDVAGLDLDADDLNAGIEHLQGDNDIRLVLKGDFEANRHADIPSVG